MLAQHTKNSPIYLLYCLVQCHLIQLSLYDVIIIGPFFQKS